MEKSITNRVLSYYDPVGYCFYQEDKSMIELEDTFNGFLSTIFDYNLLVFCDDIMQFPYVGNIINYPKALVFGNKKGNALCAKIKGLRNTTRWIVQASSWSSVCSLEFLKDLRDTFDHCKVGTFGTPGGLGQGLMRKSYQDTFGEHWKHHRHTRPCTPCQKDILGNMTGGRVDTPGLGQMYEKLYELDKKNAYLSHYGKHPGGSAIRIVAGGVQDYITFFCRCTVTIQELLPLGPFPVRKKQEGDKQDVVSYPVYPGVYEAWMSRERVEVCEQLGCSIEIHEGWAWDHWTYDNIGYVNLMELLRDTAPPNVEPYIKQAAVSGIGRHGMSSELLTLVGADRRSDNDEQVVATWSHEEGIGGAYSWWIHHEKDFKQANQTHWFWYTIELCSIDLFIKALEYAKRGLLASTNYDAVFVTQDMDNTPWKEDANLAKSGTWRKTELHSLLYPEPDNMIPAPRAVSSREKNRRPGVKKVG
jgi:hypothetical protein